jgi:hypothetical protein
MGQIVVAKKNREGNYILEVKPLDKERISETGETIQVAGTKGWAERLTGCFSEDEEGNPAPLTAVVQIRRKNKKK